MLCRWVGTCCSVSANLALGPEAPMVHLGACAAHVATHAACGEPSLYPTASMVFQPTSCPCCTKLCPMEIMVPSPEQKKY